MPRIALAQIDVTVGDIAGNADRVVDAARAALAQGADLLLVPELALTGYPPEDLLAQEHFVDDAREALDRVAVACSGLTALVGFVDREGDTLYNAAALCRDGGVVAVYRKRRLPNYGVFDEERYFACGRRPVIAEIAGTSAAVTICEDVWVPELAAEAAELGAGLLLNISASPFHAGKGAEREAMLRARARDNGVWLAYCNLVGGQDELVFDGRSLVDRARRPCRRTGARVRAGPARRRRSRHRRHGRIEPRLEAERGGLRSARARAARLHAQERRSPTPSSGSPAASTPR